MKESIKKFFKWLWTYLKPFTNWRFLICHNLAWFITNGAWYVLAGALVIPGTPFPLFITPHPFSWVPLWLVNFSRTYVVLLFTIIPEKLISIPLSIFILSKLFKNHPKTRAQLDILYAQAKNDWVKVKNIFNKHKAKVPLMLLVTIFCVSPISIPESISETNAKIERYISNENKKRQWSHCIHIQE